MAPAPGVSLPLEMLTTIARHLDRNTMKNFSLASRLFYEAAKPHLYHTMAIWSTFKNDFSDEDERSKLDGYLTRLTKRVDAFIGWVDKRDTARCVRCIRLRILADNTIAMMLDWPLVLKYQIRSDLSKIDQSLTKVLKKLVSKLDVLRNLHWCSQLPFPADLLPIMREHRAPCHLHVDGLNLRGLLVEDDEGLELHSSDIALLTSPILRSISIAAQDDLQLEFYGAILVEILLAGGGQSLQRLSTCSWYRAPRHNPSRMSAALAQIRTAIAASSHSGALPPLPLKIEIQDQDAMLLRRAPQNIDVSKLGRLELSYATQETLDWLTINMAFPAVKELGLMLDCGPGTPLAQNVISLQHAAVGFIKSIPPVQKLTICGVYSIPILTEAFRHHGNTLKVLRLKIPLEHTQALSMQQVLKDWNAPVSTVLDACAKLEELHIPVKRLNGSKVEVKSYEDLGKHSSLARVTLYLYGAYDELARSSPLPADDVICAELRNVTVDRVLAIRIYEAIHKNREQSWRPLQSLRVFSVPAHAIAVSHKTAFKKICGKWSVKPKHPLSPFKPYGALNTDQIKRSSQSAYDRYLKEQPIDRWFHGLDLQQDKIDKIKRLLSHVWSGLDFTGIFLPQMRSFPLEALPHAAGRRLARR